MTAILMFPFEHSNIWRPRSTIPHGPYIEYGCFIKRHILPSCDIPRPEICICIHQYREQGRANLGKNLRIRCHTACIGRNPARLLGSWQEKSCFLFPPFVLALDRDEDEITRSIKLNALVSKYSFGSYIFEDENSSINSESLLLDADGPFSIGYHPVEEPWLSPSSIPSNHVVESEICDDEDEFVEDFRINSLEQMSMSESLFPSVSSFDSGNELHAFKVYTNAKEYQTVEEPWICEALVHSVTTVEVPNSVFQDKKVINDEKVQSLPCDQQQEVQKKLLQEVKKNVISHDSVSTVILINTSICTMQRIAVLEDDKLVELLLEPVKNNVQCDSVYLGVVTKMVPQMSGAFINIGGPRSSFMEIKSKRGPFVFPPFRCHMNNQEANGYVPSEGIELTEVNEDEYDSDEVEDADETEENEMVDYSIGDFRRYDLDNNSGGFEAFKENVNGSVIGFSSGADNERYQDHSNETDLFLKGQNGEKLLCLDIGCARDSQMLRHPELENIENGCTDEKQWFHVQKGTKIIVQVVKEGLGTKGPTLTAYPKLRSRFLILSTRCNRIGISKKISGVERTRLRVIAKTLQPQGFGLTVRTVAAGHSLEELQKDLEGLLSTWKIIEEHAKSAALAADEGVEGAVPVLLHRALGQTLSIVQDYFSEKVKSMIVDSPRTYHEVMSYLQGIAPDLCERVELYSKRIPLFDEYNIEEEINTILSKNVPLANGGYLVIEQTEALVSIDVNGGHCMLGQGTSQEKAILDVNLTAARQIARELRLRDIGGIIVVDFIDMTDDSNKRLVYEEVKKAVEKDRSPVKVSELSRNGLMEITRKRVRPSVTFMISEPCTCCHGNGRVEALETSFSKIEHEIGRSLAMMHQRGDPEKPKSWPRFILRVDRYMCNYLTSGKRTRLAVLSSSLKVWILLKVARGFTRGAFELKPLTDDKELINKHQSTISMLRTEVGSYSPSRKVTLFPIKKWRTGGK